jgi:membrane protease YdiL (CAAX protease family)
VAFVFLVALFFGWAVARTGSLLGVTLSHGIANVVLYVIVPFTTIAVD